MTGWRKKQIMMKQEQVQMEKRDPLDVVKIVVESLDDAYAAGVRNSSKRPEWVGLTYGEVLGLQKDDPLQFYIAIEAKLKAKNFA